MDKEPTFVASLFHIINDRIKILLSLLALRTNECEGENVIHLSVTFTRKTRSWYNGAANLILRIISPVLRSEMRLVMPRCIKFKWNGAKVAHYVARGSEGGTSRQKMSSWRKGGKGQRWTIKSSYYPYYRQRCERTRARRSRMESLLYVHPLRTRCRTYGAIE